MPLNANSTVLINTSMAALEASDLLQADLEYAPGALEQLRQLFADYQASVSAVRRNSYLSAEGQDAKIGEVQADVKRQVSAFRGRVLERNATRLRELDRSVAPPVPKDDVGALLQAQEIRAVLRDVDPVILESLYVEAGQCGDIATMNAIDTAPSVDRVKVEKQDTLGRLQISDDARQRGQAAIREFSSPQVMMQIRALRDADNQIRALIGDLEREVGEPDSLSLAATGPMVDQGGPRGSNGGARAAP